MKPLKDIRIHFNFKPVEGSAQIKYFRRFDIDWDVYLPSRNMNLQRELCWSIEQKRELIWSFLLGRHIPHLSLINSINREDENKDKYLLIDGKQRLSTIFDFYDDKFTIVIDGDEYLFSQLPEDYQNEITSYHIKFYVVNEPWGKRITDDEKYAWFKLINFAGTPQDNEHLKKLENGNSL